MVIIIVLLIVVVFGVLTYHAYQNDTKHLNTIGSDAFPALRPRSLQREDVRAHRKETNAYLMEAWEVRFEAAVGATQLRDVLAKGTYEMEAMRRRRSKEIESHFSPSVFGRDERSLKRQYGHTFAKIANPYDEEIYRYQRGIADVTREYNTLTRRNPSEKIPTWRWH